MQLRDGQGGFVSASCIVARETVPPEGHTAFEWGPLSNRAVSTLAQAIEMIDWYRGLHLEQAEVTGQVPEPESLGRPSGGFLARKADGEPGVKTISGACAHHRLRRWHQLPSGASGSGALCITRWSLH